MPGLDDTIFALATPPGRSAIAVIRISGGSAHRAAAAFGASAPAPGQFRLARLKDGDGQTVDEALLLAMAGPRSSTGEDVLEIHCHGSSAVVQGLLQQLAALDGFRPAEAGEFTHRMFANGRIDLLGVEALADLIDSETDLQRQQAWAQMDGALRGPATEWREKLIALAARLETLIDFADEDLPPDVAADWGDRAQALATEMQAVLNDGQFGERVRNGVRVALLGPVNAGKSTLLNHLAGREAAIVSDTAGTTRDVVTATIDLGGVPVMLLDTAGIRETGDSIEAEGVRRARQAAQDAEAALVVVDGSRPGWREEVANLQLLVPASSQIIVTKSDLGIAEVGQADDWPDGALTVTFQGDGADAARHAVLDALYKLIVPANQADRASIISRLRHRHAIKAAVDGVMAACLHDMHTTPELAAEDLRHAADSLGRMIGVIDVEDLLDSIFASFCIGK
tara:strand:- start:1873 stop:3234 length:1362 start_codon:yes stop_codon:yes gene_type:complete